MSVQVFGEEWLDGWRREINADAAYREAGRKWKGGVTLRMWAEADPERSRAVFLDLSGGECHAARPAGDEELKSSTVAIGASDAAWRRVLAGEVDPVLGLMRGTLKLEKGNLIRILPFAEGARALLRAATRLEGELPDLSAGPSRPAEAAAPPDTGAPPEAADIEIAAPPETDPQPPADGSDPRPASARSYRSVSRGLDGASFPMRLWHKAKKLGVWDPAEIDFARDAEDWRGLDDAERDILLRLTTLFQAGEEAVAVDLLPLIDTVASEGRLEEELYLTSFLFEEAKHVEFFRRFFDEVAEGAGDLTRYVTPSYETIFARELPEALRTLRTDRSIEAQVRASVTYNMIVEGVLAETGYHGYLTALERRDLLPGIRDGIRLVKRDESRHIAYGLFLLSRLVAEGGEAIWREVEGHLDRLIDPAIGVIREAFEPYDPVPFGLDLEEFLDYGMSQFRRRCDRLEIARREGKLVIEESE